MIITGGLNTHAGMPRANKAGGENRARVHDRRILPAQAPAREAEIRAVLAEPCTGADQSNAAPGESRAGAEQIITAPRECCAGLAQAMSEAGEVWIAPARVSIDLAQAWADPAQHSIEHGETSTDPAQVSPGLVQAWIDPVLICSVPVLTSGGLAQESSDPTRESARLALVFAPGTLQQDSFSF